MRSLQKIGRKLDDERMCLITSFDFEDTETLQLEKRVYHCIRRAESNEADTINCSGGSASEQCDFARENRD